MNFFFLFKEESAIQNVTDAKRLCNFLSVPMKSHRYSWNFSFRESKTILISFLATEVFQQGSSAQTKIDQ